MITFVDAPLDNEGVETLGKYGEVRYHPVKSLIEAIKLPENRMIKELDGVDVYITGLNFLKETKIEQYPSLQIICSCHGNPNNINIGEATKKGIPVLFAPGRNADAVSDLAIALMLILGRNIMKAAAGYRDRDPSEDPMKTLSRSFGEYRGNEMLNKVVGIIGFGSIGRKVAERLLPFGSKLISYDPYVDEDVMAKYKVKKVDLDTLMKESDFVTVHVMPSKSNKGFIGAREICLMKETAYFINTARSWVTDEKALIEALQKKKIRGGGFDVYDVEPLPLDHPFMSLDNVVLLPHIGGQVHEAIYHHTQILVDGLECIINGQKPNNIINPQVLENFKFKM